MGFPVHWIICLMHMNELPLRELFKQLDGETSGPKAFGTNQLPVCHYEKVCSDHLPVLPANIIKDLSTDKKYFYEICHATQEILVL